MHVITIVITSVAMFLGAATVLSAAAAARIEARVVVRIKRDRH